MKTLLIFLLAYTYTFGAPAFNKTREFTQSDGTTFSAKASGDRYLNWIQTKDGEVLKYNAKTKNFEYATIEDNKLNASGVRYEKNSSKRARSLGRIKKLELDDVYNLWKNKRENHPRY